MRSLRIALAAIILQAAYIVFKNLRNTNNVCKTFNDYYSNRDSNENCYYNPDYRLTVPEIIRRYGYPLEVHNVTTDDGHILTLFRIPGSNINGSRIGKPVLLQHGFVANSAGFVNVGQKSLGFFLANHGYDVWLGNFRGTKYSKHHTHLTTNDDDYWNYTFHENGIYDLPAFINHISNVTKQKITYIGFSMGTTAMNIYSSTFPAISAEKVDLAVSLAPATYTGKMQSFLKYTLNYYQIFEVLRLFIHTISLPETWAQYICGPYPFQMKLCYLHINFCSGFTYGQLDPETLLSSVNHVTDALHLKTNIHIVQGALSNEFRQYDYGPEMNLKQYGVPEPPFYNLSQISVPTYLVRAENDLLVVKEDVEKLHRSLPKSINKHDIYVIEDPNFSHMDFLIGKDAVSLLYMHLLDFIQNNSKNV